MSGQESAGRPQDPLPCRRPLPSRRPRARHHHVEAQDLLTCDTSAARCQSPLAASQRRLTMTNSLNRYSDGVTELRQGSVDVALTLALMPATTPIEHVVIVVKENHGLDNYVSTFPSANGLAMAHSPK